MNNVTKLSLSTLCHLPLLFCILSIITLYVTYTLFVFHLEQFQQNSYCCNLFCIGFLLVYVRTENGSRNVI